MAYKMTMWIITHAFIHNALTFITEQGNSEPEGRKEQHVGLYVWVSIPVQVRRHIHSFISAQMQAQCKAILIKAIRKPPAGCLIKKEPIRAAVRSTGVMQQVFTLPDMKPLSCESENEWRDIQL